MLGWPRPLPLEDERARLLREIGQGLINHFGGSAARLINAANGRADVLVDLVVRIFGGFRDVAIDPRDGSQVFLYKRAQIFVGDLWGRFNGRGLGRFDDSIKELTMFADYGARRVARNMGILKCRPNLARKVDQHNFSTADIVPAGSAEEVDVRACTVRRSSGCAGRSRRDPKEPELNPTIPGEVGGICDVGGAGLFLWTEASGRGTTRARGSTTGPSRCSTDARCRSTTLERRRTTRETIVTFQTHSRTRVSAFLIVTP